MLHLHFANRLEHLADLLVEQLGAEVRTPFELSEVVIPSAALQRHLTLRLAQRHGICAQVRFSWLAQWLWQQMSRVLPGVPAQSPLATPLLGWRIFSAFGDAAFVGPHTRLADYLAQADPVMRFELAQQVAALFDQYLTYRPEWLSAWGEGQRLPISAADESIARADEAWQAALWRRVLADLGVDGTLPAQVFMQALQADAGAATKLPPSLHVFALPTMPPAHLALLQQVARHVEVRVYAINPCREYWFDVVDRRRLASMAARGRSEHLEVGHRLLADWGRQTRSQLALLVDAAGDDVVDDAHYDSPVTLDAPPASTLLARLQASMLDLAEPQPGSLPLHAGDRSLEVHVCHSLTRELEVLHDRLLGLFASDSALRPGDVLVVTPDLEAAAPLIDAVFGSAPGERRLPYVITGLARSGVNRAARVLLELLALLASRCKVSAVFALLQQPLVARRFALDDDELDRIQRWLREAGVHWALDAAQRSALDLPDQARHSFEDGLDRLFLAYALPAADHGGGPAETFAGLLPAGEVEGHDALALGGLWRFVQALVALRGQWAMPRPAGAWPALLSAAVLQFIEPDDDALDDLHELNRAIEALGAQFVGSRFDDGEPIGIDVLQVALARQLDDPPHGGVPTGSITFSSMSSLRNLPHAVVCVLGLDDGRYPSADRALEFDLMSLAPRDTDRQRRRDERNLFLDLLLAARQKLHLSFCGRSVRDNAVLPPSVLVAELLDLCVPAIADDPADPASLARARARLVVEHPLQSFAEVLFAADADPRLRSFHAEYAAALSRPRAAVPVPEDPLAAFAEFDADLDPDDDDSAPEPTQPFFAAPLPAPGVQWQTLPLQRLIEFYRLPCRFLLRHRLGLELRRPDEALQDDEPFIAAWPQRRALAERLLPLLLAGRDPASVFDVARAGLEVPPGALGDIQIERELPGLAAFASTWRELTAEPVLPPVSAVLAIEAAGLPWQLEVAFADLRPGGRFGQRCDEHRAGDLLGAWLQHLALCALAPPAVAPRTTWLARDGVFSFERCDEPRQRLAELLALYRIGLTQPLYFFPKSAWAFLAEGENPARARSAWLVTPRRPYGESADPYCRLALRGWADPMGAGMDEFAACARAVLGPLLQHLSRPALRAAA